MRYQVISGIGALLATGISALALLPSTADLDPFIIAGILSISSFGFGTVVRYFKRAEIFTKAVQLMPGIAYWLLVVGWSTESVISETVAYVALTVPPMPSHAGFRVCAAIILWLLYLLVDWFAVGLSQPAWACVILFLPFLAPSLGMEDGLSWTWAIAGAAGYSVLLTAAALAKRKGNSVSPILVGLITSALAIALTSPLAGIVPMSNISILPGANDPVVLGDPSIDLMRNLQRPQESDVLRYQTTSGEGVYLRLVALPILNENGFGLAGTTLMPLGNSLPHEVYPSNSPQITGEITVEIGDIPGEWVPLPWQTSEFNASGNWDYDPTTYALTKVSPDRGMATRWLKYRAQFSQLKVDAKLLSEMRVGNPQDMGQTLEIPDQMAEPIRPLVDELLQHASSRNTGEAIQLFLNYLQSDLFTYTLDASPENSVDTIVDFLLYDHQGYCEQFAAGLAILARAAGIPSRIAVGFMPGRMDTDGWYQVTTHNMHAWTEVYMESYGWVALDSTPAASTISPRASATPTPTPTSTPTHSPSVKATPTTTPTAAGGGRSSSWFPKIDWKSVSIVTGGLIALVFLGALPRLIRTFRFRRRMSAKSVPQRVENIWLELRDRVIDSGFAWPQIARQQQATIRTVGTDLIAEVFPDDTTAASAIEKLITITEEARYAPAITAHDLDVLLADIWLPPKNRWWPKSIFKPASSKRFKPALRRR